MALAVDVYGSSTGLVSMEELLENIFGDLPSPSHSLAETDISIALDGTLAIAQFNEEFDAALEADESERVGGRILHDLGQLPAQGTASPSRQSKYSEQSATLIS